MFKLPRWGRKRTAKGNVWGQESSRDFPAPGFPFRASVQTGGHGHTGRGDSGRVHHHVTGCLSCYPFDVNWGGKRGILLPSEEIPTRAARGIDGSCIFLLRQCMAGVTTGTTVYNTLARECKTKELLISLWDFTHWMFLFQCVDYEFLFSMRELDSPRPPRPVVAAWNQG